MVPQSYSSRAHHTEVVKRARATATYMLPNTTYNYSRLVDDVLSGKHNREADLARGFLAGAIGGLIGTAVKSVAEKYLPVRPPSADAPPAKLANRAANAVAGERLSEDQKAIAEQGMHWVFGTVLGGVYGAAVEWLPALNDGMGLPFGALVFGLMHEAALPAADLEPGHEGKDDEQERNEMITHLAYGFVTEVVRSQVRKA